ncbi:MAG TPA: ABC transporter ATP-binding protein [Burkholderiaceae bacterium]|nr:ABC transporter ATP-binding protein [Burkholderiaceae bacterium]
MAEPLLSVRNVHSGYGDVRVLWGVDFDVPKGQICCLVGSNGAGKSTLMRTVSGLVHPTQGEIRFAGQSMTDSTSRQVVQAGIAHVPEGRRLFRGMSTQDNLLMGAYCREDSRAAILEDLERMYDIFPVLSERRNQDATTMSGGEQQMCAIARGLMGRPKLLLIDELSLGLAPTMVDILCETLQRVCADGLTMLLVEQDITVALELASHAFVMDSGKIVLSGPSDEVRDNPRVHEAYLGTS